MNGPSAPQAGTALETDAGFAVTHEGEPAETVLAGFSNFGLAGLTAVDFLVDHLDLEETGHVTASALPAITPFEEGRPRHHTRLFSRPDLDVTVLTGELFVPQWAAPEFGDALFEWLTAAGVEDCAVLVGVPVPHGPEQHRAFHVATDSYRARRLDGVDVPPMGAGFLDGVNAELVSRAVDAAFPMAVYLTPVHTQVPDAEAALRLLDAVERVYGLDVDTRPLEEFAAEVSRYYENLQERFDAVAEEQRPEDRMFM